MPTNSTYFNRWFIAPSNIAGRQHIHWYRLCFNYPAIDLPDAANDNEDKAEPLLVERTPEPNPEVLSYWQLGARNVASDGHVT